MASFEEATRSVGMRRVTERIPYTGAGVDSLAAQVTAILKVEKAVQRIVLDATKAYIRVEKHVMGAPDLEEEREHVDNILSSIPMRECTLDKKMSPYEYIYWLFREVTDEGLFVAQVFVGNSAVLSKWVQMPAKNPQLYGVPVRVFKQIPDDVIVACGAEWQDAELEDIKLTVKGVML